MNPVIEKVLIRHFDNKLCCDLRKLVMNNVYNTLNNRTIKTAVKLWLNKEHRKLCFAKYGHVSYWNTENVTDMSKLFACSDFNENINNWNVSNVTNMNCMFYKAYMFNQPLNKWKTDNVNYMNCMFYYATSFNQSLNDWNIENVKIIDGMFRKTRMTSSLIKKWPNNENINKINAFDYTCFICGGYWTFNFSNTNSVFDSIYRCFKKCYFKNSDKPNQILDRYFTVLKIVIVKIFIVNCHLFLYTVAKKIDYSIENILQ